MVLAWDPPGTVPPQALKLNGRAIATDPEVDVTGLLGDRNELVFFADPTRAGTAVRGRAALPVEWGRPALVIIASD